MADAFAHISLRDAETASAGDKRRIFAAARAIDGGIRRLDSMAKKCMREWFAKVAREMARGVTVNVGSGAREGDSEAGAGAGAGAGALALAPSLTEAGLGRKLAAANLLYALNWAADVFLGAEHLFSSSFRAMGGPQQGRERRACVIA